MPSTRTQIYLTHEQREAIDARMASEGKSLAWIVREALDNYLAPKPIDVARVLEESFGALPALEVPPRSESNRFAPARRVGKRKP